MNEYSLKRYSIYHKISTRFTHCCAWLWFASNMMTSSNGNIFRVAGPLCGEFTGPRWIPAQRPVTRSFDVFFDVRLNKRLSKQSWGWWFETPSHPLWRHSNVNCVSSELPHIHATTEACAYFVWFRVVNTSITTWTQVTDPSYACFPSLHRHLSILWDDFLSKSGIIFSNIFNFNFEDKV